jgi:hypothetical protein
MAKRIAALFEVDGTLIITGVRERPPGGWRLTSCTASPPTSASSPAPAWPTRTSVTRRSWPCWAASAQPGGVRQADGATHPSPVPDCGWRPGVPGPGRRRGTVAADARAGLPARVGHRQRRGRRAHQAALGQAEPVFSFGGCGSDSTDRGELTRAALRRAAVVSGGSVTPHQAFVVGDTSRAGPVRPAGQGCSRPARGSAR